MLITKLNKLIFILFLFLLKPNSLNSIQCYSGNHFSIVECPSLYCIKQSLELEFELLMRNFSIFWLDYSISLDSISNLLLEFCFWGKSRRVFLLPFLQSICSIFDFHPIFVTFLDVRDPAIPISKMGIYFCVDRIQHVRYCDGTGVSSICTTYRTIDQCQNVPNLGHICCCSDQLCNSANIPSIKKALIFTIFGLWIMNIIKNKLLI
uniref:Protein quiver n=1 Tax=Meloidogyne incognita TaxID=6306 RepID=A0A914M1T2_MELIC